MCSRTVNKKKLIQIVKFTEDHRESETNSGPSGKYVKLLKRLKEEKHLMQMGCQLLNFNALKMLFLYNKQVLFYRMERLLTAGKRLI